MNQTDRFSVMGFSFFGLFSNGMMDLFGFLETARYRYGLRTVDIWNGMIERYDDDYIHLVKENLDERGLTVANLCCDSAGLWDDDPVRRTKKEQIARDCLRFAEGVGAKTIRFDMDCMGPSITDEQLAYVVPKYEEYCAIAARFGARLGPENHTGCSRDPASLRKVCEAVKAPNFGLLLHMAEWHSGDIFENDRFVSRWAMPTHLYYKCAVEMSDHLAEMRALMDAQGYTGAWSVECHMGVNEYPVPADSVPLQLGAGYAGGRVQQGHGSQPPVERKFRLRAHAHILGGADCRGERERYQPRERHQHLVGGVRHEGHHRRGVAG